MLCGALLKTRKVAQGEREGGRGEREGRERKREREEGEKPSGVICSIAKKLRYFTIMRP